MNAIKTLEKMARALEMPMYRWFYDGEAVPAVPTECQTRVQAEDEPELSKFCRFFGKMTDDDLHILVCTARRMALKKPAKKT